MVIIRLAGSPAAALAKGLSGVLGGFAQAKQQKRENARKDEMINLAKEKMKLQQAQLKGQQMEQRRVMDERQAGAELDNLRMAGVATPEDIRRKRDLSMVRSLSVPGMGMMGGMKSGELIDAANRAKQQMSAIEKLLPDLGNADRKALFKEFDASEKISEEMGRAGTFLNKMRDVYRMPHVLSDPDKNAQLDPHIQVVEDYLKEPSEEGREMVEESQKFFFKFMQEQGDDLAFAKQFERRQVELDALRTDGDADLNAMIDEVEHQASWDKEYEYDAAVGEILAAKNPAQYRGGQRARARADSAAEVKSARDASVARLRDEKIWDENGYEHDRWVRPGTVLLPGQFHMQGPEWKRALGQEVDILIPGVMAERDRERETQTRPPDATPPAGKPDAAPDVGGGTSKWDSLSPAQQKQIGDAVVSGQSPSALGIKQGDVPDGVMQEWMNRRNGSAGGGGGGSSEAAPHPLETMLSDEAKEFLQQKSPPKQPPSKGSGAPRPHPLETLLSDEAREFLQKKSSPKQPPSAVWTSTEEAKPKRKAPKKEVSAPKRKGLTREDERKRDAERAQARVDRAQEHKDRGSLKQAQELNDLEADIRKLGHRGAINKSQLEAWRVAEREELERKLRSVDEKTAAGKREGKRLRDKARDVNEAVERWVRTSGKKGG